MSKKALFIQWCPKDALDGMQMLDPWEELAYRRALDLIYVTGNNLSDDDERMGWLTKVGTQRWKKIKPKLMSGDEPKLYCEGGLIRNRRADQVMSEIAEFRAKQAEKSARGVEARKVLKEKETGQPVGSGAGQPGDNPQVDPGVHPDATHGSTRGLTRDTTLTTNHYPLKKDSPPNPLKEGGRVRKRKNQDLEPEGFAEFYDAFPSHKAPDEAAKAYRRAIERGATAEQLLRGAQTYASECAEKGTETRYIKHPASWLNAGCWKEDTSGTSSSAQPKDRALDGIPTLARGITPTLQIMMAKKYLMVWHQDGDKVVYVRAKHPNERKPWPYRNPETNEIWPLPGQPGCPVSPEAMRIAAAECGVSWPDDAAGPK